MAAYYSLFIFSVLLKLFFPVKNTMVLLLFFFLAFIVFLETKGSITSIPVHHKVQMFLRIFSHFYINEMHTLFF